MAEATTPTTPLIPVPAAPAAHAAHAAPATAVRGKVVQGGKTYFWGTGRRKSSVARVRICAGDGKFIVNERAADDFFKETKDRTAIRSA
ncbi:MAG: 30S ribosomal protein S9, partial [Phycisphaerae bacterium]